MKRTEHGRRSVEEHHLLCLQSQLDEYLLEFFIHEVDAELLKSIFLIKTQDG